MLYNPNQTCCGQPAFNAGFVNECSSVAKKFLYDFNTADVIVAPSASCVGFVRNYFPQVFNDTTQKNEANNIGKRIYEFTEFLILVLKQDDFDATLNVKATYHDSCAAFNCYDFGAGGNGIIVSLFDNSPNGDSYTIIFDGLLC